MDPFVLDVIKHGIKLDFCGEPICSNLTPLCSLSAEGIKAVNKEIQTLLLQNVIAPVTNVIPLCLVFSPLRSQMVPIGLSSILRS